MPQPAGADADGPDVEDPSAAPRSAPTSRMAKVDISFGDGDEPASPHYYQDARSVPLSRFNKLEIAVGDEEEPLSPLEKDFERVRRNFQGHSHRDSGWSSDRHHHVLEGHSRHHRWSTGSSPGHHHAHEGNGTFSDALDRTLLDIRGQLLEHHEHYLAGDREQYVSKLQEENKRLRRKLQESKTSHWSSANSVNSTGSTASGRSMPITARALMQMPISKKQAADQQGGRMGGFGRLVTPPLESSSRGGAVTPPERMHCSGPPGLEAQSPKVRPNRGLNPDDGMQWELQDSDSEVYVGPMQSARRNPSKERGQDSTRADVRRPSGRFTTTELAGWTGDEEDEHASRKALMQLWGGNDWINLGVFFSTWRDFVQKVKAGEVYNDDDEINERRIAAHTLWPPLEVMRTSLNESITTRTISSSPSNRSTSHGDFYMDTTSSLQKLVSPPNSKKRMLWDCSGFLLVCWDAFMIPMYAFDLGDAEFVITMSWITTIFWTVDFPSNFFVAFYSEGIVEMRPAKVALHYFKTWCAIDAVVILLDWSFIALGLHDDAGQASRWARLRINRLSRVFRFLRVLRLIRAAKMLPKMQMMFNEIHSDMWRLTISVFRSVMIIVAINHVVACAWFTIGSYNDEDPVTWLKADLMMGDDAEAHRTGWGYRYTTSLHWSFCQFTPASMEVNPRNLRERIFAVIIIICGMITFSSFVSSITSSLTQLRNLNTEKHQEELLIKQYFNENRVSVDLGKCVMDWLHANRRRRIFRVHEADLPTFQDLPERLKFQLHLEVFEPILTVHPFFETFQEMDSRGLHKICHRAISQHRLLTEQELFSRGMRTNRMYFVIVGECRFSLPHYYGTDITLAAGSWCCEVALWIPWIHLGSLTASTITELVAVDAASFQQTFPQCSKMVKRFVRAYASLFVRHDCDQLQEGQPWITDVCCNPDHMAYLCYNAREWVACNFSHAVSRREHSLSSDPTSYKKGSGSHHHLGDSNFTTFASWLGIADHKNHQKRGSGHRRTAMLPAGVAHQHEHDFEASGSLDGTGSASMRTASLTSHNDAV